MIFISGVAGFLCERGHEDVWFESFEIAQNISERLIGKIGTGHMSYLSTVENASDLLNYLDNYKIKYIANPDALITSDKIYDYHNLLDIKESVNRLRDKLDHTVVYDNLEKKYPPGTLVECQITGIKEYGLFVEFGINGTGLIHISHFPSELCGDTLLLEKYDTGDAILAQIIEFKSDHGRFNLLPIIENY